MIIVQYIMVRASWHPHRPKEKKMPYVNIKVTREGVTKEQKEQLISGVTQLLVDVLGKNPKTTFVVIDEVETDNWGIAGQSVTHLRSLANKPEWE